MSPTFRRDKLDPLTLSTVLARGGVILAAALVVSAFAGTLGDTKVEPLPPAPPVMQLPAGDAEMLRVELANAQSALAVERMKLRRADAVQAFSAQYRIPADLSAAIYDHAVTEGIDPAVAFRLVQVESNFRPNVRSRARAIGYTQLKLGTAKHYEPWITERELRGRDVNLRIGFRFLRDLMRQYGGDEQLALLAYNRGPARVNEYLDNHGDPDNGYATKVLTAGGRAGQ
jgi:soluble lytic murein transglycosylase-like protein